MFLSWLESFKNFDNCEMLSVSPVHRSGLAVPVQWLGERAGTSITRNARGRSIEPKQVWIMKELFFTTIEKDLLVFKPLEMHPPYDGELFLTSVEFGDDYLTQCCKYNVQDRGVRDKWTEFLNSTIKIVQKIKLSHWSNWKFARNFPWTVNVVQDLPIVIWARPSKRP